MLPAAIGLVETRRNIDDLPLGVEAVVAPADVDGDTAVEIVLALQEQRGVVRGAAAGGQHRTARVPPLFAPLP